MGVVVLGSSLDRRRCVLKQAGCPFPAFISPKRNVKHELEQATILPMGILTNLTLGSTVTLDFLVLLLGSSPPPSGSKLLLLLLLPSPP